MNSLLKPQKLWYRLHSSKSCLTNLSNEIKTASKQALDYLLCYYLLNENLNSFKNAFDTYYKGKFEVVPRLYEEALVQVLSKSSDEEVAGYQIPQDVIENYQDYIHCKSGRKAKEELRERYSSTYWYYSDYIH